MLNAFWARGWFFPSVPTFNLVLLERTEHRQGRVLEPDVGHRRPFVVAIGEVGLGLVAREVFQEADCVLAVRGVPQHAPTRDIDVRSEVLLVREYHADLVGHGAFGRAFFELASRT